MKGLFMDTNTSRFFYHWQQIFCRHFNMEHMVKITNTPNYIIFKMITDLIKLIEIFLLMTVDRACADG